MSKNIPWDIIIKKFEDEISSDEQAILNEWLARQEHLSIYKELEALWLSIISEGICHKSDADSLWAKMENRMKKSEPKMIQFGASRFRWLSGVASVILLFLLSFSGYMTKEWYDASTVVQIYSSLNGKSKVVLPDGSQVWLNTESTLEYTTSVWNKTRNVQLEGEAYFEVKKDTERPFIVKSQGVGVRVYGTAFNVEARDACSDVRISLLSGSVQVESSGMTQRIVPGEMAVYHKKERKLNTIKQDVGFAAMWANESIHFERKSIKELTKYLSKWYGVKIIFDSSIPEDQAYTFSIRNEPLEEILRLMARTNPIRYSFDEKNSVKIMKK